jgi:hypothetical protein
MKKQAGRYASEGGLELRGGMGQSQGFGNMNRFAALFPMGNNSAIARQGQASGMNQNPASTPSVPNLARADTQGIMQAAQKVADYSFGAGLNGQNAEGDANVLPYLDVSSYLGGNALGSHRGTGQAGARTVRRGDLMCNDHDADDNKPIPTQKKEEYHGPVAGGMSFRKRGPTDG